MHELSLLKSLLKPEVYRKYRSFIKLPKELQPILSAFDGWYTKNTVAPCLEDIANLTFAGQIPEKEVEYTKGVFSVLQGINGSETVLELLESLKKKDLLSQISLAAYEAQEGRRSLLDVSSLVKELDTPLEVAEIEYVTDNIHDILKDTVLVPGLRWRLDSLNKSVGSLRKGNFVVIFARPESGKTAFVVDQAAFMASQLTEESGPVLFFNNEEMGEAVKGRLYQAALGCTINHLRKAPDRAQEAYREATKGKIRLLDSASIHKRQVEEICEREKPSLIIFDQIDKIKGFKADREDLALGAIYQWAREMAKTYCPVIGVCQADASAEGQKWLNMDNMANSKTAKAAEADAIIGIGKTHDAGFELIRFLNLPKNKLGRDADCEQSLRHGKFEVILQPEINRYKDID